METFDVNALPLTAAEKSSLREFVASWERHAKPVLFVGAGFSKFNAKHNPDIPFRSRFGSWEDLLDDIRVRLAGDDSDVRARLATDPLRLAQIFEQHFGRVALLDLVVKHVPNDDYVPGAAHEKLRAIRWSAIVTTNYDDLVERTFHGQRKVRAILHDEDLTQRRSLDDLLVLKLHGDLSARDTIVLTEEDYRRYPSTRPGISVKARQLLLEHPILFVGFSLTDPHFTMIDGWIRDTVQSLRLPAIAVIHSPAIPAERAMWHERGVTTVHLGQDSKLEHFFTALANERARSLRPRTPSAPDGFVWQLEQEARKILESAGPQRVALLADQLRTLIRAAGNVERRERDAITAIRWFAHGWHNVLQRPHLPRQRNALETVSAADVYEQLSAGDRRDLLLLVLESGMEKLQLSPGTTLDAVAQLASLGDVALTRDELARANLYRARIRRDVGDSATARKYLLEARAACEAMTLRKEIEEEMREVLFQEGDAAKISEELQRPPEETADVFAMCRRGADYLLLGQRESAAGWYSQALQRATDGDEKYSALWGGRACTNAPFTLPPDELAREAEVQWRHELNTIPREDRPRAEAALDLVDQAGQFQLDEVNTEAVVEKLTTFLGAARHMGWPHSPEHGVSYLVETTARRAGRVLMALAAEERPDGDGAREGLPLLTRYGLARDMHKLFTDLVCERLARRTEDIAWFRQFATVRPTLARPADAHVAAVLRGVPLLDDEAILRTVRFAIGRADGWSAESASTDATILSTWLQLISEAQEHLPQGASALIIQFLTRCVSDRTAMIALEPGFDFTFWREQGFVVAGSPEAVALGSALARSSMAARSARDKRWLNACARLALEMFSAGLLDRACAQTIRAELRRELAALLKHTELDTHAATRLAHALATLGGDTDDSGLERFADRLLDVLRAHRRSSDFGMTLYVASRTLQHISRQVQREVLEIGLEHANRVAAVGDEHFSTVSGLGYLFEALARKVKGARHDILSVMARVLPRSSAALRSYSSIGGPALAQTVVAAARQALLSGQSHAMVLRDVSAWLSSKPHGDLSSIVGVLIGLSASESRDVRSGAVAALGRCAMNRGGRIDPDVFDVLTLRAQADQSFVVRARALNWLRRLKLTKMQASACQRLADQATRSHIAIERRLGPLLAVSSRRRPSRATSQRARERTRKRS